MSRNIFISFLGSSNYKACFYVKDNYASKSVRYVQKATLEFIDAKKWNKNDKAFILVTDGKNGSFIKNWKDNGHVDFRTNEVIEQIGLKTALKKMNLPFSCKNIQIKDGKSEEEIWDIFETIFNLLNKNDKIYIDITHGFRYLPMLSIVLANYGKLLKGISIKNISYGNFESRNEKNEAPIIDLTSFSQLQDWTNAVNLFVDHGNLNALALLTKQEITPILTKSKGKDKTAIALRKLSGSLKEISLSIMTNNAPDIISGNIFAEFKQNLNQLENDLIKPLNPILKKIEQKLNKFSNEEDVMNGFKSVDFCLESGLIQQAYTMLQESVISLLLDSEELDMKNIDYRAIVSGCFKIYQEDIPKEKWKENNIKNESLTNDLLENKLLHELSSSFNALTDKRNVINHAGFNNKSSTKVFKKLERDVIELNRRIKEKLNQLNYM